MWIPQVTRIPNMYVMKIIFGQLETEIKPLKEVQFGHHCPKVSKWRFLTL